MAIGTYEQYRERLLRIKLNVYLNGICVDHSNGKEGPKRDLIDWIKGGTYVVKQRYDVADDPDYADVCITTSHVTGEKIDRHTHIHRSQEGLLKEQLMAHLICHRVGRCMQRCMGADAMNALFSTTYDCGQACGIEYYQRLLNYIEYYQKYDLICNYTQTDVKGPHNPRCKRACMQPNPDSFVHVVDTDVDDIGVGGKPCKGIIVRDAKVRNSNVPHVDEIIVDPTKFMGSNDADYAAAFALPGDWDGVKPVALPGLHHKRTHLETPLAKIDDVESLTILDDCFVPYGRVSMCGHDNEGVPRYASYLTPTFTHYHRHSYTGCKIAVSEVIASQAALVADVNDIAREPRVCEKLRDIIQTVELVFTVGEVSAYHAAQFPSGQWAPDGVLTNAGRRLAGHDIYHEYETLVDLTGSVCTPLPTEESFFAPETTELCNKCTRRDPACSAEDTHHAMRTVENRLCDSYEAAQTVTGVHGSGSPPMETITMMSRYDLRELKKIAKYLVGTPEYGGCPRHKRSTHTVTPRAMLAEFDAMTAARKETK